MSMSLATQCRPLLGLATVSILFRTREVYNSNHSSSISVLAHLTNAQCSSQRSNVQPPELRSSALTRRFAIIRCMHAFLFFRNSNPEYIGHAVIQFRSYPLYNSLPCEQFTKTQIHLWWVNITNVFQTMTTRIQPFLEYHANVQVSI